MRLFCAYEAEKVHSGKISKSVTIKIIKYNVIYSCHGYHLTHYRLHEVYSLCIEMTDLVDQMTLNCNLEIYQMWIQ